MICHFLYEANSGFDLTKKLEVEQECHQQLHRLETVIGAAPSILKVPTLLLLALFKSYKADPAQALIFFTQCLKTLQDEQIQEQVDVDDLIRLTVCIIEAHIMLGFKMDD